MKQIDYVTREKLKEAIDTYLVTENKTPLQFNREVSSKREILYIMKSGNIKKILKGFKSLRDTYYYTYSRGIVMDADDNYYYTDEEQLKNKFIFVVGNEQVSLFDLYNITDEEIMLNLDNFNFTQLLIFKILYSHFVNKKDYTNAEIVYKEMIASQDQGATFSLIAYTSDDYIPFLTYCDKAGLIDKPMIKYYLNAIYNKKIYINNDFNREFYKKMQKKYSDLFRLANVSAYLITDAQGSRDKPEVNNFDLVDSDPVVRERVFRVFDGPSGQILKSMIDEDFDKTHKMVLNFLNTQYYKGKKKAQFISTYSRLKEIFEKKGHKLDVFQLNEDLQSHIVFDMLN